MADGEDAAIAREWVALQPTLLKASIASSMQLPDNQKLAVSAGARLSALLMADEGDHWLVGNAFLDGVATADNLRYLFKRHWTLDHGEVSSPEPDGGVAPMARSGCAERKARHRRLHASFRRRMSQR